MYSFIVQLILMASLGIMVYLLAKALPRVSTSQLEGAPANSFDRFLKNVPLERMDLVIQGFIEKILRKTRIIILKLDNAINNYLESLKKNSAIKEEQTSMKEKFHMIANGNNKDKELK